VIRTESHESEILSIIVFFSSVVTEFLTITWDVKIKGCLTGMYSTTVAFHFDFPELIPLSEYKLQHWIEGDVRFILSANRVNGSVGTWNTAGLCNFIEPFQNPSSFRMYGLIILDVT